MHIKDERNLTAPGSAALMPVTPAKHPRLARMPIRFRFPAANQKVPVRER